MTDTTLRRLEEIGLNSCSPPGTILYDGWLLRLMPGKAKRARSVNAAYGSTLPLGRKIAYCEALYREHRLPLIFRITPFSEPMGLDTELSQRGYRLFDETAVETTPIDLASPLLRDADATPMALAPWVDAVTRLRGGSAATERDGHLLRLQSCLLPHRALAIVDQGVVVATGLTIVEDGWGGLFDIVTDPGHQRKGHARRLVAALLRAAWELGARQSYLQVSADNAAARPLYRQFGFVERYGYWYRAQPGQED